MVSLVLAFPLLIGEKRPIVLRARLLRSVDVWTMREARPVFVCPYFSSATFACPSAWPSARKSVVVW